MVRRTKQSSLLGKALKSHAKDETSYGRDFTNLPAGITAGIAQLTDAKLGIYKPGTKYEGEQFIRLAGSVVQPKTSMKIERVWQDGEVTTLKPVEVEVFGQFTKQMFPLCETISEEGKVTAVDANVVRALNELRMLGGEDFTESLHDADDTDEELKSLLETLEETKPYFKFSTTASPPTERYPQEKVWENWRGSRGLEEYDPDDEDDVVDETDKSEEDEPESSEEDDSDDEKTLADLAEAADNDDADAAEELQKRALAAGVPKDVVEDEDNSWADVAKLAEAKGDKKKEDPEKEDVFNYKPPRARKAVQCEVMSISKRAKTCNLKNLVDPTKIYKSVPWDKLIDG